MIKLFIAFAFCLTPSVYSQYSNNPYKECILEIEHEFASELKEQYGLQSEGNYMYSFDACMSFGCHCRATSEEARHLVVYIKEKLTEKILRSDKIRPYLGAKTFNPSDIFVDICFYNPVNNFRGDGSISHVLAGRSHISYYTKDTFTDRYGEVEESYKEAKRVVETTMHQAPLIHKDTQLEYGFDEVTEDYARAIAENLLLDVRDIGCKNKDQLASVDIRMTHYKKAKEKRARTLVVKAVDELLASVNSNTALHSHLGGAPFRADRVRMRINFRNDRGCSFDRGSLESVEIVDGKVTYFEDKGFNRVAVFSESFAEAKDQLVRK